jgi:hypothetical protein
VIVLNQRAPEKTAEKLPPLLPRRSDSPRAREGHARRSSYGVGAATREQNLLTTATRRPTSPLHCRGLNLRPVVSHLHCLTYAGVQGDWCHQSHSGHQIAAMLHAILRRLELTGRPPRNYSNPEDQKIWRFAFWRTTAVHHQQIHH